MTERKQDTWRVIINAKDASGKPVVRLRIEGVVDLPRPMAALDAADYALRCVTVGPLSPFWPHEVTVAVWGRADIGSNPMHLCSAVGKYDGERGHYMRYTPWLGEGEYREIGDPEGAAVFPLNPGGAT